MTLAEWLDSGWEADDSGEYVTAGLHLQHGISGWGAHFGTWQQHCPDLPDFPSHWDAWAFVFAATGIDALAKIPESLRRKEKLPQPDTLAESTVASVAPTTAAPYAQFLLFERQ